MKLKLFLSFIARLSGQALYKLIDRVLPQFPPALKPAQELRDATIIHETKTFLVEKAQIEAAEIAASQMEHCQIFSIPEVTELGAVPTTPVGWTEIEPGEERILTRSELVQSLLDEGWNQGLRTYAQLMKYVELQTGTACSKRVVSNWKKSRFPDLVAAA